MEHTRAENLHIIPQVGDSFLTNKRRPLLTIIEVCSLTFVTRTQPNLCLNFICSKPYSIDSEENSSSLAGKDTLTHSSLLSKACCRTLVECMIPSYHLAISTDIRQAYAESSGISM